MQLRAATVRVYLLTLLNGTGRLNSNASSAMARDIDVFVQWCDGATYARDRPGHWGSAEPELSALDGVLEMMGADADEFASAYGSLLRNHPDAPMSVAEVLLNRRPELAKCKKSILSACQKVHADCQQAELNIGLFVLMSMGTHKRGGGAGGTPWFKK